MRFNFWIPFFPVLDCIVPICFFSFQSGATYTNHQAMQRDLEIRYRDSVFEGISIRDNPKKTKKVIDNDIHHLLPCIEKIFKHYFRILLYNQATV